MELSRNIVKQFVEITNDSETPNDGATVYGSIVEYNNAKYAKLDGSSELTPISSTVDIKTGDRVTVSLKNHTATVTGNLSDPSASSEKLNSAEIKIDGFNITLQGYVTFDNLSSGTTTIDGACIKTGTIDADRLNLTGAITFNDLASSVQSDIEDAYDMADSAYDMASDADDIISDWGYKYKGTTYIDGEMIMTGTVRASTLESGEVSLLTEDEDEAGVLTITGATSATYAVELMSYGALRFMADYGAIYLESGYYTSIQLQDSIQMGEGDVHSNEDDAYSCGTSRRCWTDVYATNSTIQTSDANKKTGIEYGLDKYDEMFDKLKPVSFLFKSNTSGRRHVGLIAQDIEETLSECGLTSLDFAGFIKSPKKDEEGKVIENEYDYALRYGEFIAMCIDQIQKLKARVKTLEDRQ